MRAASRRAEIIRVLRGCGKETVPNLAREFGVNERTIRRDLLFLTVDEGHLIDTKQGNGGGVFYNGQRYPYKGVFNREQIAVLTELKKYADSRQLNVLNGMLESFA
jgi:predicted DNA-binding transcriptional regulator YafY